MQKYKTITIVFLEKFKKPRNLIGKSILGKTQERKYCQIMGFPQGNK